MKFKLLTSPSFAKVHILSILFLATRRDPRKFPASTAVAVLAFPSSYLKVPIKFAGTHLYTWVERGTVRVKCLTHNTMSPARARTRTARSGDERTSHEAGKNTLNLKNRASLANKSTVPGRPKILQLDL